MIWSGSVACASGNDGFLKGISYPAVSKYAVSMLTFVASGQATLEDILPVLEKREREKRLERERLARKRAQKLAQ